MSQQRKKARRRKSSKSASRQSSTRRQPPAPKPRLADVLEARERADLEDLYRFWTPQTAGSLPSDPDELRRRLTRRMVDPQVLSERIGSLGRRLGQLLSFHLEAPGYQCSLEELAGNKLLSYLSSADLEASLAVLQRHGLLCEGRDTRLQSFGGRAFAIPRELGDGILRLQRDQRRGLFDALTLRGFLDRMYDDPRRARTTPPTRVREMYKMYSDEAAAVARIERLPDGLRGLVEKGILQFGGLLPRSLFERMDTEQPQWHARRWRKQLEESLVGTVDRVELARYGIQHADETLVIFNEVALAWLRRVAVPGDPDAPHSEASLGVDLASNISRFLGFIMEHNVRFTVRGEIFKTTEKRILQELIPNPGRELERSQVLAFIYQYCRGAGLIESTGERTFAVTALGRPWEQQSLDEKLGALLDYVMEEQGLAGDYYHQGRMRRIFMRLLKRVTPNIWYDLMYLPFLARNTYLASLDQLAVDEYFSQRSQASRYVPMEDLQRLAWNLARWLRQRLYLLGLIDLGYDRSDRPVALRLTRIGARILGVEDDGPPAPPILGSIVVTPDFEVVLFPTGDDSELVHELDRFCVRDRKGTTLHFRVSERSICRALSEGMHLSRILDTLRTHSRTPVPQNVLFSIRDWARRAGLMTLDEQGVLSADDPDLLRRFQQDPGAKVYVGQEIDENRVQLASRFSRRRTQALLRELGFLIELSDE